MDNNQYHQEHKSEINKLKEELKHKEARLRYNNCIYVRNVRADENAQQQDEKN